MSRLTALATAVSWGSSYAVTQTFRLVPVVVAFSFFLACALGFFAFVYCLLPVCGPQDPSSY